MTLSVFAQVRAYTNSLVHASARLDPLTAARHRAFIAPRLVGGLLALTALPMHLAVSGVPGTLEILFYGWLATPILVACYLSRTGQYERAQLMSSASLTALIAAVAMATGGITSFAAVWLVVVPLEAALRLRAAWWRQRPRWRSALPFCFTRSASRTCWPGWARRLRP